MTHTMNIRPSPYTLHQGVTRQSPPGLRCLDSFYKGVDMRTFITTALAATLVSVASIGTASAFTSTGVLESVDTVSNTVKIRNGDAYKLPASADLSGFQAGERVN